MSKYIKLEDALKGLNMGYGKYDYVSKVADYYNNLPTIDIVHCGECKYWKGSRPTSEDDFCSYGERIEE